MTLIITDRPLEDFLEHIPPTKGPVIDEVHTIGGKEIHTRSDLWNPREYAGVMRRRPPLAVEEEIQDVRLDASDDLVTDRFAGDVHSCDRRLRAEKLQTVLSVYADTSACTAQIPVDEEHLLHIVVGALIIC